MNLHDLPPGDGSLLLTTDDLKTPLSDYLDRMSRLVSCPAELQRVMFEYLYFGRDLIVHRKRGTISCRGTRPPARSSPRKAGPHGA